MTRLCYLGIALAVAACSPGSVNPASILQPDVKLHHLALKNVGLSGGTVELALAFHNPNRVTLRGAKLAAGLEIEGSHFGDVDLTEPFSLAGRDTTLLTLPLSFRWSGLARAARSAIEYGAVNYAIKGSFTVTAPVLNTPLEVPFTGQGNVPLLRP